MVAKQNASISCVENAYFTPLGRTQHDTSKKGSGNTDVKMDGLNRHQGIGSKYESDR